MKWKGRGVVIDVRRRSRQLLEGLQENGGGGSRFVVVVAGTGGEGEGEKMRCQMEMEMEMGRAGARGRARSQKQEQEKPTTYYYLRSTPLREGGLPAQRGEGGQSSQCAGASCLILGSEAGPRVAKAQDWQSQQQPYGKD